MTDYARNSNVQVSFMKLVALSNYRIKDKSLLKNIELIHSRVKLVKHSFNRGQIKKIHWKKTVFHLNMSLLLS